MTTKDKLTLGCRFYSGEKTNPFFEELNAHAVVNPDLPPSESMTFEHDLPREKEEYLHEAAIVWLFESYWVREKMRGEIYYNFKENLQSELQAIKQIEDNGGKTLVSEGVTGGYLDIINYSIFCLIKMRESQQA